MLAGKGRVLAGRYLPGAMVLCAAGGAWKWYKSDSKGWIRVGDAVDGCFSWVK